MEGVIRVLVVDDSAYVRKVVKQMLSRSPFIDVVGVARDGEEALEMVEQLKPDVVTLDLIMPGMGGLGFLQRQMQTRPVPVIIVSISNENSKPVLDALDLGAIDFIQKPSALATDKVFEMSEELITKVKTAAAIPLKRPKPHGEVIPVSLGVDLGSRRFDAVVIGISTGGPQALKQFIPKLPSDYPVPIAIVLHMPAGYTEMYAKSLGSISQLEVVEAQEGLLFAAGRVVIAQAGRHLFLTQSEGGIKAHLDARPFDTLHRPSVDVLFRSAAEVFGPHTLGVVMTGMGDDGKEGATWIKSRGGVILTEDEGTCIVYGMPRVVAEANLTDRIVPLDRMADVLMEVAHGKSNGR